MELAPASFLKNAVILLTLKNGWVHKNCFNLQVQGN